MKDKIRSIFDEKMWKFLLVGVLNTLVGNGLSFLLLNGLPWESFNIGSVAAVNLSSGISTVLASIMSYFLNKHFTFRYQGKDKMVALRFALNILVCYVIAYSIAKPLMQWILYNILATLSVKLLSGLSKAMVENISMVIGMCSFVACNYFGQRFFAFREKKEGGN